MTAFHCPKSRVKSVGFRSVCRPKTTRRPLASIKGVCVLSPTDETDDLGNEPVVNPEGARLSFVRTAGLTFGLRRLKTGRARQHQFVDLEDAVRPKAAL